MTQQAAGPQQKDPSHKHKAIAAPKGRPINAENAAALPD
jgi:hypothetical protein